MRAPSFEELVGDEELFFAKHFDQQPLLRRNSIVGDPRKILSSGNLDELLYRESLRMPYVGINRPPASYRQNRRVQGEIVTDCVVPERVYEHFKSGATVQWFALNHFFLNLRELTAMLGEKFAVRSEITGFLTPPGATGGPGCHEDPVDIFVIQLEGTKSWKVWGTRQNRSGEFAQPRVTELGTALLDIDLEPGDVLYMPHNTPHLVTPKDEMSLHLSVAIKPRRWSELLAEIVDTIVNSDPDFQGFPYLGDATAAEQAQALKDRIAALAERLSHIDAAESMRRLANTGREREGTPPSGHAFRDTAAIDHVNENSTLVPGPAMLTFGATCEGKVALAVKLTEKIQIDGKISESTKSVTIKVPEEVAANLRRMRQTGVIQAGDLLHDADPDRSVKAAKTLARLGVVTLLP